MKFVLSTLSRIELAWGVPLPVLAAENSNALLSSDRQRFGHSATVSVCNNCPRPLLIPILQDSQWAT